MPVQDLPHDIPTSDDSLCMLADQNLLRNEVDLTLLNFGSESLVSAFAGVLEAAVCTHPPLNGTDSLHLRNRRAKARAAWVWTGSGGCRSCYSDNTDLVTAPTQAPSAPFDIFDPGRATLSPFEDATPFIPTASVEANLIAGVPIYPTIPNRMDSNSSSVSKESQSITTSVSTLISITGKTPSISSTPVITPIPTLKPSTMNPTSIRPTTRNPSLKPTTTSPTTRIPTLKPTSRNPTSNPTTKNPTRKPTTMSPTSYPTSVPTTKNPTLKPTTRSPTSFPTSVPTTKYPTLKSTTRSPTSYPTSVPTTKNPTLKRTTRNPTSYPTSVPTTKNPTLKPTTRNPAFVSTTALQTPSSTIRKLQDIPATQSVSAHFPRGLQRVDLTDLVKGKLFELAFSQNCSKTSTMLVIVARDNN
jgi:hypothetical protein